MQDKLIEESRCAHKRVVHRPMPIEGGLWTDRWYCDLCRCEFTPLAVRRSHCDAGTDEGLRKALAEGLSWALDLLDMYDKKLIEMGEPAELVYAPIHLAAKEKARKTLQASHAAESTAQIDAEDPAEPVEDVPPGYVKLNDVEKAIRAVWKEHYHSQAVWSKEEFLSKLMARLAPKPEPSQSAVIDTLRSEDFQRANACIECGTLVVHQELHAKWHAALVDRRTK